MNEWPAYIRDRVEAIRCRSCGAGPVGACFNPLARPLFVSIAFADRPARTEFCYERLFDYFESFAPPLVSVRLTKRQIIVSVLEVTPEMIAVYPAVTLGPCTYREHPHPGPCHYLDDRRRHIMHSRQIGDEGPDHNAAWAWECRCGRAKYAATHAECVQGFQKHVADESDDMTPKAP